MKFQFKIIAITLFVLVVTLILSSVLSLASFEKIYVSSLISTYETAGKNLKRKIEQSLRFGKPLDKFQGMDALISEVRKQNTDIVRISVGMPDGTILYHSDPNMINQKIKYIPDFAVNRLSVITKLEKGVYLTYLPLYSRSETLVGIVHLSFSRELVYNKLKNMAKENFYVLGVLVTFASLILIVSLSLLITYQKARLRIGIFAIAAVVIVSAQIFYSYTNIASFKRSYLETLRTKCQKLGGFLKDDVEYVLNMNIPLTQMPKLENTLKEILNITPELEFIEITDTDMNVLYYADAYSMKKVEHGILCSMRQDNSSLAGLKKHGLSVESADTSCPLMFRKQEIGYVNMRLSPDQVTGRSREILWDMLTVILTSLLMTFEALTFLLNRMGRHYSDIKNIPYSYIRPMIFLFIMADGFCTSFFPLYADMLYQPMLGISREVMMGLPISAFMLSVVFSMPIAGNWSDRAGWYKPLMIGIFANVTGLILTAMAQNMVQLLLFRCLTAIGFGVVFIAGQRFVADNTDSQERAAGMASFISAFSGGSICGTVMGGMLADRIGYRNIFLVSGMISLSALVFCLYFFKNELRKTEKKLTSSFPFRELFNVLRDPEFFSVVFLQAIPAKIILIGCLFYLVPLYLKSLQILQSDIGRVIMTYNIAIVFLGYFFSKYFDKETYRKYYIFIGGMLTGVSMICFYYAGSGFLATLLLVAIIGVSHTFSISSQISVITETEEIKRIGTGTGMGVFRFWERLGNVAGPLITGSLIIKLGYIRTVVTLGIMSVTCSILYLITILLKKYKRGKV